MLQLPDLDAARLVRVRVRARARARVRVRVRLRLRRAPHAAPRPPGARSRSV